VVKLAHACLSVTYLCKIQSIHRRGLLFNNTNNIVTLMVLMVVVFFISTADELSTTGAKIIFMNEEAHCIHSCALHLTQSYSVYASPAKLH